MRICPNSFPRRKSFACLIFLAGMMTLAAVDAEGQRRSAANPYQKIALKTTRPCAVGTIGEVTSLVKNGVELSVNEDWDCDGIADAYDNCVGMPNRSQTDADGSGIGDVCETATLIKTSVPVKHRSNAKARSRKSKAVTRRSRSSVRRRRSR